MILPKMPLYVLAICHTFLNENGVFYKKIVIRLRSQMIFLKRDNRGSCLERKFRPRCEVKAKESNFAKKIFFRKFTKRFFYF